jgi:hypothetical protein
MNNARAAPRRGHASTARGSEFFIFVILTDLIFALGQNIFVNRLQYLFASHLFFASVTPLINLLTS